MSAEFDDDLWIRDNIKELPKKGFFVDCGCADPVIGSMTKLLRDSGWTGISIEGDPYWAPLWEGIPGFVGQVIGDGTVMRFKCNREIHWISCLDDSCTPTQTKRLSEILFDFGDRHIDLLNIDLEGYEFEALQQVDLEKHSPTVIVVEYMTMGKKDFRCMEYLMNTGKYWLVRKSPANMIFLRQ